MYTFQIKKVILNKNSSLKKNKMPGCKQYTDSIFNQCHNISKMDNIPQEYAIILS